MRSFSNYFPIKRFHGGTYEAGSLRVLKVVGSKYLCGAKVAISVMFHSLYKCAALNRYTGLWSQYPRFTEDSVSNSSPFTNWQVLGMVRGTSV